MVSDAEVCKHGCKKAAALYRITKGSIAVLISYQKLNNWDQVEIRNPSEFQ